MAPPLLWSVWVPLERLHKTFLAVRAGQHLNRNWHCSQWWTHTDTHTHFIFKTAFWGQSCYPSYRRGRWAQGGLVSPAGAQGCRRAVNHSSLAPEPGSKPTSHRVQDHRPAQNVRPGKSATGRQSGGLAEVAAWAPTWEGRLHGKLGWVRIWQEPGARSPGGEPGPEGKPRTGWQGTGSLGILVRSHQMPTSESDPSGEGPQP